MKKYTKETLLSEQTIFLCRLLRQAKTECKQAVTYSELEKAEREYSKIALYIDATLDCETANYCLRCAG